jgi:16S rRNA (cytidine1402-2'-O)-methyltransferase
MPNSGILFIVATPIGNLADITLRALETLKKVDLIAAEDTRHSKKLLDHYSITTPVISLHNYNETKKCDLILNKLQQGKNIALITDAGTPLISDPGYHLVKTIQENNLRVVPIPGACAAIAALSAAGLPTNKFVFEGFLSPKSKQQLERLQELVDETRTLVFYESPHRLLETINNMRTVFGDDRYVVLAKELTKTFETIYGGTFSQLQNWLTEKSERQKGEFVILVKGIIKDKGAAIDPETLRILNLLSENMPHKQAVILTAKITGANKNILYKHAL